MESNNTTGYFHVALMNGLGGLMVASEMHGRLLDSGLYDATEKINVTILGDSVQEKAINDYIFSRYSKYQVRFISSDLTLYEWPTLKFIYDDAKESENDVWYIHTKGASNCRPDVPAWIQHNIRSWRGVMSYWVINQHKECKKRLTLFDAVGPLIVKDPPYFAGNFWWASARYIRRLKKPEGTRNEAEGWIGTCEKSLFSSMCPFPILGIDLYDFQCKYGDAGVFRGILGGT
jgi:hypothetical protein